MDRRRFLVLAAGVVGVGATATSLAGCTPGTGDPAPAPSGPATVPAPVPPSSPIADPDAQLRAAVAATELALIAQYRRAIEAFPERSAELGALMAQHEEHVIRVAPGVGADPSQVLSSPPVTSPEPDPSRDGSVAPSPASDPPPTLARLAAAETAARAEHITSCDTAADPALARDLCLMAGSEAQHAVVLAGMRRRGRDS